MPVISISISEELLREADEASKRYGYGGRSGIFRAALHSLLSELREHRLSGYIDAILLVVHGRQHEEEVSRVKHEFESVITTQIHSHLQNEKCLNIFILRGDGKRIGEMVKIFRGDRKIDYVKLVLP